MRDMQNDSEEQVKAIGFGLAGYGGGGAQQPAPGLDEVDVRGHARERS